MTIYQQALSQRGRRADLTGTPNLVGVFGWNIAVQHGTADQSRSDHGHVSHVAHQSVSEARRRRRSNPAAEPPQEILRTLRTHSRDHNRARQGGQRDHQR
jgi:hypothetical protein